MAPPGAIEFVSSSEGAPAAQWPADQQWTLIVPCVSVGNVAQLCTDALATTYGCKHVGYLRHEALLPVAGVQGGMVVLACEVFEDPLRKVVLLQRRAPLRPRGQASFSRALVAWIKRHQFARVVVATSVIASVRTDSELEHAQAGVHFAPSRAGAPADGSLAEAASQIGLARWSVPRGFIDVQDRLVAGSDLPMEQQQISKTAGAEGSAPDAPLGDGATRPLWRFLSEDAPEVDTLGLVAFASQGDNAGDGIRMAAVVDALLLRTGSSKDPAAAGCEQIEAFSVPESWNTVFGTPHDQSLYG